jgi:hypothetical protein
MQLKCRILQFKGLKLHKIFHRVGIKFAGENVKVSAGLLEVQFEILTSFVAIEVKRGGYIIKFSSLIL